jgi:short-subunit dehydrogenase
MGTYVLVTGGTSGIGYELAKLFAEDGYNLIIVARDQDELFQTKLRLEGYGVDVVTMQKDLFQMEAAFELCEEIKRSGMVVTILVNNAGQGQHGLFVDNDINRELDIIHLNVCAVVILTKFFLREMVARKEGKILNLASLASEYPGPWQAVYHATKAFVLSFTEAIQHEVEDTGVVITALQPGVTDTDFFNKADMNDAKAVQDEDAKADPAKVAKDGYDALMAGKLKVVSGFKNKMQAAMSNVIPDKMATDMMAKQNEPVEDHTDE